MTDVINKDVTSSLVGATGQSSWTDITITGTSGAEYVIHTMGLTEDNYAIRWNKNGYLYASKSGGKVKSVTITGVSKSVDIYASNSAYSAKATATKITSLTASETGATYEFTTDYAFIAINGTTSSTQITSIEIVWEEENQDLQESDLALTSSSTISIVPEGTSQITYTTSSTGAITWTSMNPSIATVENGVVTGVETGTTIVTLEQAADANYKVGTASVIVKVVEDGEGVWNAGFTTKIENGLTLVFNTDNITATYLKVEATVDPYSDNDEIRVYKGAQLTFAAPEGYEITNIVFTCTSKDYATALSAGSADTGTLTANESSVTWAGVAQSVEINNSSGQARISKIVVSYGPASEKNPSDFTITSPTTIDLVLPGTPTATVTYTTSSTGTISWASADEDVAKVANGVITAVAAGTTTISVSQVADANYEASEEMTITVNVTGEAAPLENIAALTTLTEAGEYKVTLTDALVTYVNGTKGYIEDASGAVMLYGANAVGELVAGDKISGTATVTYTFYNGLPEVTALTLTEGYTKTSGNEVTPTVVTIAELNGENYSSYISRYVKIVEATVTSAFASRNSTIKQGDATIVLRDQNNPGTLTTTVDDVVTVTAHPAIFNTTKQIAVYEQSQIVVKQDDREAAEIAFSPETLTITQGDAEYTTPEFVNPHSISLDEITFTSSNENVADWDDSGLVFGTETGTATITATFAGNTEFKPATATLVVTVNENLNFVEVVEGSGIYQKITSASDLEVGKRYLIVGYKASETAYYAYNGFDEDTSKKYGLVAGVTVENDRIDNTESVATPVVLQKYGDNWFIMDDNNFLAYNLPAGTTKNNNLFSVSEALADGTLWTIDFESTNGYLITNAYNTERSLEFNSDRFACYLHSQQDVVLYKELGELAAYAVVVKNEEDKPVSVTFYYDDQKSTREGENITIYNITTGSTHEWSGSNSSVSTITEATFDVSFKNYTGLTTLNAWFLNCQQLSSVNGLTNLNTENVKDMGNMFWNCYKLGSLDLSSLNTDNLIYMYGMFGGCSNLTSLTFGESFSTANVEYMYSMFSNCQKLTTFDVGNFDTGKVKNMQSMFWCCYGASVLDLSNFKTSSVTNMKTMFYGCKNLQKIIVGDDWTTDAVTTSENMFQNCTVLVGGAGTAVKEDVLDKTFAILDGGAAAPGYLTYKTAPAAPTFSVEAGEYTEAQTVTITAAEGTTIYYTTDGTNPDAQDAEQVYTEPVTISQTATLKAIAVKGAISEAASATYTIAVSTLKGDVNKDGTITIADVTALVNIILGKDTEGVYDHEAADVNTDGSVTIADVTALVNIILGKTTTATP